MNVTGKMRWMPGVLVILLMVAGGCSKKSVQGSAGVGAGDRSGMEMQADAGSGSTDGQASPGGAGVGEEDLQGGERTSSGADGASTSSSESSESSSQAGGEATGSDQVAARPDRPSGSTPGSGSQGIGSSQRAGDEGSRSQASGGDAENTRLAQKRDGSADTRARTMGPAGDIPGDREVPIDISDGDGAEDSLVAGRTEGGDAGSMGSAEDGPGDSARGDRSSDDSGGTGARTEDSGPDVGLPGAAGEGAAAMADNGDAGDSSSKAGGDGGSDDMTADSRGRGGAGRELEDPGTGEGMGRSAASSGEEDVSESMIVAKAPPPDDAARQRLEDMKRERMESDMRGVRDVFFAYDSWQIRKEDQKVLESNAEWLKAHPQVSLTIEGHADPRGTQAYNLTLGKKRAETIRSYLAELGVDPERMHVVSYGKERLFCREQNERCFQMNRRGHLVVETP